MVQIKYEDLSDIPEKVKYELIDVYSINPTEEQIKNICNYIIYYYNNPDLMQNLSDESRDFYEKFTSILAINLENKKDSSSSSSENANEKTYRLAGFSNIMLLSSITIIIALIIIIILM